MGEILPFDYNITFMLQSKNNIDNEILQTRKRDLAFSSIFLGLKIGIQFYVQVIV